jgi:hypothetical protein
MLWGGGALQLLEHAVPLDAARDDDGGGNAEVLAREVDLLGRLRTLELVDLKRVPVHTANGRGKCCECQRALTRKRTLWGGDALELGDIRLLEDGGERRGALGSDAVVSETVRARGGVGMVRVGVSMGIDRKATLLGGRRT